MGQLTAARFCLLLIDNACVQVSVDCHLLPGHGVQREARNHLRYPAGTFGHDNEVDDHKDQEDDKADNVIACDDEFPEGLNHLTRSSRAGVALHQYNSGRGNVQPEPQQCRDQ